MTLDQEHAIDQGLSWLNEKIKTCLAVNFRELAQYIEYRVVWCGDFDAPWLIRLGDTQFECIDFYGIEPVNALIDFNRRGIAQCANRLGVRLQ